MGCAFRLCDSILVPEVLIHRKDDPVVAHDKYTARVFGRNAEDLAVLLHPKICSPDTERRIDLRNIEDDLVFSRDLFYPGQIPLFCGRSLLRLRQSSKKQGVGSAT